MPRFVSKGPVVPEELVQELEDDRVVIFCGAGISMGAGLPSYAGLVKHCYTELGRILPTKRDSEWLWPDRMLGALENEFSPHTLRSIVAERLSQVPADLELHKAILRLSRLRRSDGTRLVTTNFDTFFEQAQAGMELGRQFHSGPILPIPRNDHIVSWQSVVYLHGRLEQPPARNDHLVLTSADFGRAYLTEAWAARFVARLFADFTVLFIGYSLNDPVLRYMTDAFAAEDASSKRTLLRGPAYIFIPHKGTSPDPTPFRQRKLEPIFYNQFRHHLYLKKTLMAWASARADYLANTSKIITRTAPVIPASLDPSDAANLLWAVTGRTEDEGHGARVLTSLDPPAPIEWLDEFERAEREKHQNFVKARDAAQDSGFPSPDEPRTQILEMFPQAADHREIPLSATANALIGWLLKHLGEPKFVDRVIAKLESRRRLHGQLRRAIRRRLQEDHGLLDGFVRFWRIVSAEGSWSVIERAHVAGPLANATSAVLGSHDEAWIKQEVLAALRPALRLKRSLYRALPDDHGVFHQPENFGTRLREIADAEIVLPEESHIDLLLRQLKDKPYENSFWSSILGELTLSLKMVFDLLAIAGEANRGSDLSSLQRPSIQPHAQNRHHDKWTQLFDLIWNAWLHIDANDSSSSLLYIQMWRHISYPAFGRLALAATMHTAHMTPKEKLEALFNA